MLREFSDTMYAKTVPRTDHPPSSRKYLDKVCKTVPRTDHYDQHEHTWIKYAKFFPRIDHHDHHENTFTKYTKLFREPTTTVFNKTLPQRIQNYSEKRAPPSQRKYLGNLHEKFPRNEHHVYAVPGINQRGPMHTWHQDRTNRAAIQPKMQRKIRCPRLNPVESNLPLSYLPINRHRIYEHPFCVIPR